MTDITAILVARHADAATAYSEKPVTATIVTPGEVLAYHGLNYIRDRQEEEEFNIDHLELYTLENGKDADINFKLVVALD